MEARGPAHIILTLLLSSIAVFITANILPGVHVQGFGTALMVAVVLGIINTFIRPVIFILTLPINILTLGLFTLVIIAGLIMLTAAIVPGFQVDGFWWAIAFAFVLWIINSFLFSLSKVV
jgi:putative membrane protein